MTDPSKLISGTETFLCKLFIWSDSEVGGFEGVWVFGHGVNVKIVVVLPFGNFDRVWFWLILVEMKFKGLFEG